MYDYMRALEDRFTPEAGNTERRQELETYRQAVSVWLGGLQRSWVQTASIPTNKNRSKSTASKIEAL